ncbi:MAG: uroporphyrinogen decarboxylase family protein, partial [Acidobacteriota bacterium]|nr:uroporphyrinogen decarboxylase family protein [Acidobacteriota bacterium]
MTKREMNLKVFERKKMSGILFQPRIEWWYQYNKARKVLPKKYQKMSLIQLFDDLDISIRYFAYATGLPGCIGKKYKKEVKVEEKMEGEEKLVIISTPRGNLVQKMRQSSDGGWRTTEFPVKTGEDIEKAIWLFENTYYVFIKENFEKGSKFFKDRGEPQFFVPRSGYQHLAIRIMGVENLIYALADFPKKVERLMQAIDNSYDTLYDEIISSGKVKIVNFGENIDANIISPRYFEKYCIPFYEKRVEQLRKAGIYTHIHIDGSFKSLLKYLKDLPFDGLEALTPLPQGD